MYSIGRKLDKMIKSDVIDDDEATDILKALQSLPMTLEMLKKTRVGLSVNTIRKQTNNTTLAALTKSLIKSWKKLVPSPATPKPSKEKSEVSEAPYSGRSEDKKEEAVVEESSVGSPKDDLPEGVESLDDPVRNTCRDLLYNAMKKRKLEDSEITVNVYSVASEIERAIFEEMRGTNMKYKNRVRSRVSNLGDEKNPDFIAMVLNGSVPAERVAKMSPEEMASQKMREKRTEYTKEGIREAQMSVTGGSKTNLLTCGKCKKRDVTYNQMQTRSADEPMTTFCFCNLCGHRWKFC